MYKSITNLFLYLLVPLAINAQAIKPCGTPSVKSDWLTAYQQRPVKAVDRTADTILYIPMVVHNGGSDEGEGHYAVTNVLDAFCTLNEDFKAANIQFYLAEDIRLLPDSKLNEHETTLAGGQLMLQYNVPNAVNSYILKDPAANCGYSLPWASLAVNKSCAAESSHTWAHEVGHYFTLPHPFLGWEGGTSYDGSEEVNYDEPAPPQVLVDYTEFKNQPFEDTLIIDTILVEKVDGSNCQIAADGFCDTSPDYLGARWQCNRNKESDFQTDPDGVRFRSDATLIMSYSSDDCTDRFTPEQIAAMRAYLQEERTDLLVTPPPLPEPITDVPQLLFPIAEETVPVNAIELAWDPVPNATRYVVQVTRVPSFPGVPGTFETDEPFLVIPDLNVGRRYRWRVRAYNFFDTCTEFSEKEAFTVGDATTAIPAIEGISSFQVFPSILNKGTAVQLSLQTQRPIAGILRLFHLSGIEVYTQSIKTQQGAPFFSIPTGEFPSGMYWVGLETEKGKHFEKIIIKSN